MCVEACPDNTVVNVGSNACEKIEIISKDDNSLKTVEVIIIIVFTVMILAGIILFELIRKKRIFSKRFK